MSFDFWFKKKLSPLSANIRVKDEGIVLKKTDLPFENGAVFNPACIEKDAFVHMFYRASSKDGISSIGYCKLKDTRVKNRAIKPILFPEFDYESRGLEDPRISFIDGTYYLLYTAYDGKEARVAYAESRDLIHFEKKGLISSSFTYAEVLKMLNPQVLDEKYFYFGERYQYGEFREHSTNDVLVWDKDASLFPKKINGKFAMLHRIMPGIQIVYFENFEELKNLEFWRKQFESLDKHIVMDPKFWFETETVGGGAPPIETPYGWLMIYHGLEKGTKIYRAGAALLDSKDPQKIIGRLKNPLFFPTHSWEKDGVVNNVVFPTGTILRGNKLYIYHGAGDKLIAARSLDIREILKALRNPAQSDLPLN